MRLLSLDCGGLQEKKEIIFRRKQAHQSSGALRNHDPKAGAGYQCVAEPLVQCVARQSLATRVKVFRRSWARQSSGAPAIRPKFGDIGYCLKSKLLKQAF